MPDAGALGELPLTERVTALALALGFDLVGVARAGALRRAGGAQREWVERGFAGEMHYIGRRLAERLRIVARLLDGVRSVIVAAVAYGGTSPPVRPQPRAPGTGWVSRYAVRVTTPRRPSRALGSTRP